MSEARGPKQSGLAPDLSERAVNEQQPEAVCVILDGPLTVRGIDAAQAKLAAALSRHTIVTVDCTAATEVDLSLIQLLIAARNSATHAGKTRAEERADVDEGERHIIPPLTHGRRRMKFRHNATLIRATLIRARTPLISGHPTLRFPHVPEAETARLQSTLAERDQKIQSLYALLEEVAGFSPEELADLEKNGVEFTKEFIDELERDLRAMEPHDG